MKLPDLFRVHGWKCGGIMHVGAAMLEEAEDYQSMGNPRVIWIEALPKSERRESRAHEFKQTLYERLAFSDAREPVKLRVASNEASSSILPFGRHSAIYPDIVVTQEIDMESRRPDEFFGDKFPPEIDTLVLDVQGAELKVLKGMGRLLNQIQRIWCEVNLKELYTGCALKPELDAWLKEAGFPHSEEHPVHLEEWSEALYWR
jgi:FkbM family methyltransferase